MAARAKKSANIIWVQGSLEGGKVCIYERDPNHPGYTDASGKVFEPGEVFIAGTGGPRPVYRTPMVMEAMRDGKLEQVEEPDEAPEVELPAAASDMGGGGLPGSFLAENDGDPSPAPATGEPGTPISTPKTTGGKAK